MFLNAFDHAVGQLAAHRPDNAVAVRLRRGLRVDFQRAQVRHLRDGGDVVADGNTKDLPDIGRRVGADQQHALVRRGQLNRRGAGNRGLADAALAGEKQKTWRLFEELHGVVFCGSAATAASAATTGRFLLRDRRRNPSPTHQVIAGRIASRQSHFAINQRQGQSALP